MPVVVIGAAMILSAFGLGGFLLAKRPEPSKPKA